MLSLAYKPRDKYDWLIFDILRVDYVECILNKLLQHDPYTFWHCVSVARESIRIADCIGESLTVIHEIGVAAILHDIGKLNIPVEIIRKPGRLTPMEFDFIKQHPLIGADMVHQSGCYSDKIIQGIRNHHINLDGTGYGGILGTVPSLYERIIRIADSFDAMTDNRPYHDAFECNKAILQLKSEKGTAYDPFLVDAFSCVGPSYKIEKSSETVFNTSAFYSIKEWQVI